MTEIDYRRIAASAGGAGDKMARLQRTAAWFFLGMTPVLGCILWLISHDVRPALFFTVVGTLVNGLRLRRALRFRPRQLTLVEAKVVDKRSARQESRRADERNYWVDLEVTSARSIIASGLGPNVPLSGVVPCVTTATLYNASSVGDEARWIVVGGNGNRFLLGTEQLVAERGLST